ncbi:MAG: hypothetical protein KAQ69_09970 [Spirochaetales bacterium]|nr:hypothetical protein [Spirochaetales bacterium]
MNSKEVSKISVQRVTGGPMHHFFGYYDKSPWDNRGRYLLAMENSFADRNPTLNDPLTVGAIDLENNNRFEPLAKTLAWNWQQGCMLKWMPPNETGLIGFNDLQDDHYIHVTLDLKTREKNILPWALYDVSSDGRRGGTLNFERITHTRPGYGYFGLADPFENELCPENDGIYIVDLVKQSRKLVFSLAEACGFGNIKPDPGNKTWFNHIKFNPSGTRMIFLQRWAPGLVPGHHGFKTRMFTIGTDGSHPTLLVEGVGISHFDWFDDENIAVWLWSETPNHEVNHYFMIHDPSGRREVIGKGQFEYDGHCSFSPDRKWMLTDTYPKGENKEQALIIYNMQTKQRCDIGKFASMQVENDSWRCDMHPRWNRDGTQVCIDSTHEKTRQMYIVSV